MRVLDRQGKPVDPAGIEWSRYGKAGFPCTIRQDPGPENALGRIKFMFPNKHAVYLHDMPSKQLFKRIGIPGKLPLTWELHRNTRDSHYHCPSVPYDCMAIYIANNAFTGGHAAIAARWAERRGPWAAGRSARR
jgi:hypothetical protein